MIDLLHQIAEDRGGRCLAIDCKDSSSKLWWVCSEQHRWEAAPVHIRRGKWCPVCAGTAKRKTIEDMQGLAAEKDGRCLSDTYVNCHTKLVWECAQGHQWLASPNSVKYGSWCPHCAGNAKYSIDDMRKLAAERGGRCLSESYKNGMTKLEWECSEGHTWGALPMKVIKGTWCRKCSRSKRQEVSE